MKKEEYYKDYWIGKERAREEEQYYQITYDNVKSKVKIKDTDAVLDVGGGNGQLMSYLGVKHPIIFDISDSGLKVAESEYDFDTFNGDVEHRFPFKENSFDIAFCCEVLEHLNHPSKTLSEINNVLKYDGVCYISIPTTKPDGMEHKQRWKMKELVSDLKKCGFEVEWINNIPRFNLTPEQVNMIKSRGISPVVRFMMVAGNIYIPTKIRSWLCRNFPDLFSATQIVKCRRVR